MPPGVTTPYFPDGKLSGLGTRLMFAFIFVIGLTTAAAVLGWFELRETVASQQIATETTIPELAQVRGFSEASARIVALAPELAMVQDHSERAARASWLYQQADQLNSRLSPYLNSDTEAAAVLQVAINDLRNAIGVMDVVVQRRLKARADLSSHLEAALSAANELGEIADTLVANAESAASASITGLYDSTPGQDEDRFAALDRLIEVELFQLSLMLELRAQASELGLLVNRIASLPERPGADEAELELLRHELDQRLTILSRRTQTISDPVRENRAAALLALFGHAAPEAGLQPTHSAPDIIKLTKMILSLNKRIIAARASVLDAAGRIEAGAGVLATSVSARALDAGTAVLASIRWSQKLQATGTVIALTLAFGFLWLYVRGNITRRLDRLTRSMVHLADGKSVEKITPMGHDEIAEMERALGIFQAQALHNQELERERLLHLQELQRHRNELQALVEERTLALREEVAAHDIARGKAEAADRAKSEFLAMMSHEIRTPMNGMQGMIRSIPREGLSPQQNSQLSALENSSARLMVIFTDILDFIAAEQGHKRPEPAAFSLPRLVQDAVWLLSPAAREKQLDLRLTLPTDLPDRVYGDRGRLRQVLVNLLSNAIRYTEQGHVELEVCVTPLPGGRAALAFIVRDTGPGIPSASQSRIFEPFERGVELRRHSGGTGLGLAICRRFTEQMGGTINLQSTEGPGATFTLKLELAIAEEEGAVQDQPLPTLTGLSLLVVEDHPINRMVIAALLEQGEHYFAMAETGAMAVDLAATGSYDAVLMDVDLPDISGTEALRRIRALPDQKRAQVPVIGISAHTGGAEIAANLAAGMAIMLPKPVSATELTRALAAVALPAKSGAPTTDGPLADSLRDLSPGLVGELASLFLTQLDVALVNIATAAEARNYASLARETHQLASAAANFNLPELTSLLQRISNQARRDVLAQRDLYDLPGTAQAAKEAILRDLARAELTPAAP